MANDTAPMTCPGNDRHRGWWAVGLNAVAPGCGLIVLRQDRRGVTVACLYSLFGLTAIWSLWIVPGLLPESLAIAGLVATAAIWVAAQRMVWRRRRLILSKPGRNRIAHCCTMAGQATEARRFAEAEAWLCEALEGNDEDPSAWAQRARLATVIGRFDEAHDAWEATLDLDKIGTFRREAIQSLERLPARTPAPHSPTPSTPHRRMKAGTNTGRAEGGSTHRECK